MGLCTQRAIRRFQHQRAFCLLEETPCRNRPAVRSRVRSRCKLVPWQKRFVRLRKARILRESASSSFLLRVTSQTQLFGEITSSPLYGTVQRVDQRLNLDELVACSLGLPGQRVRPAPSHARPCPRSYAPGLFSAFRVVHSFALFCLFTYPRSQSRQKEIGRRKMIVGSSS